MAAWQAGMGLRESMPSRVRGGVRGPLMTRSSLQPPPTKFTGHANSRFLLIETGAAPDWPGVSVAYSPSS